MKFLYSVIFACTVFSFLIHGVSAQISDPSNALNQQLDISIVPKYPGPNENVTITVRSNFFDIDTTEIGWRLNGTPISAGRGDKVFKLKTGDYGQTTTVEIILAPKDRSPFNHFITLSPSTVDLIWQAHTYTPPFYLGKALMSNESLVTVSAVPRLYTQSGALIPKESLLYFWKINGKSFSTNNGLGKYSIEVKGRYIYDSEKIEVEVFNEDKTIQAIQRITLNATEPRIGIYELHPLYGTMMQKNLSEKIYTLPEREVTLIAEPFFISMDRGRIFPFTTYNWLMNGARVDQEEAKGTLTLRNETNESGNSQIGVSIAVPNKSLQNKMTSLLVQFDN